MAININQKLAVLIDADNAQAAYLDVKEVKSGEGDAVQTHLHVRRKANNSPKA